MNRSRISSLGDAGRVNREMGINPTQTIQQFAAQREAEYKDFQHGIYQRGSGWHTRPRGDRGRI